MPNRDYAVRTKSKKGGNKLLIILIILLLLGISGLGLWFLQQTGSKEQPTVESTAVSTQPKATLPSRPEETYSYIRDLETREVPINSSSKYSQLTKEQEQQILKQQQLEKQKQEQQAQAQVVQTPETVVNEEDPNLALAKKKEEEKKIAEEKLRKHAELKKQQELAKKAEQTAQAKAEQTQIKEEKAKTPPPQKIVATAKPASEAPKQSGGKYGLQCGAFKSKAQAENMQARLAMAGYNARINSSADWNRVVVGPVGDRAAASSAQSNARSVAECLIVGM